MTEEMGHQLHQAAAQEELGLPINIVDPLFDAINNNIYSVNAAGNCGAIPELREPESVPPLLPSEHLVSTSSRSSPLLPELQPMAMPDPFHAAAVFYQQQPPVLKRSRSNLINNEVLYSQQHHGQLHDRGQSDNVFSASIGSPTAMELLVTRVSSSSSRSMSRANGNMGNGSETRLSPQSVAARERRKRISNKTQELGRLVPGGHKMGTAEMFQAAAKYVKFLQAQVGILGLIPEYCNNQRQGSGGGGGGEKELQQLLATTTIQEKLYRADRCIVPKQTVEDLVNDPVIKSHLSISRDLGRLTGELNY